jgi:uncharacterized membrane protein
MYKGWTRIYYGAFKSIAWLAGVMALTLLFTLAPFAALAWAAVLAAIGDPSPFVQAMFCLAALTTLLVFVTMRRYFIAGRANPWYLFFYPLAVVLALAFQFGAVLRALGLRSVTWRGTTYKGSKVVSK